MKEQGSKLRTRSEVEEINFWDLINGTHRELEKQPGPEKKKKALGFKNRSIIISRRIKLNIIIS